MRPLDIPHCIHRRPTEEHINVAVCRNLDLNNGSPHKIVKWETCRNCLLNLTVISGAYEQSATPVLVKPSHPIALGDIIEQALITVGVTKDRVSFWLGTDCGCSERQQKLNQLGYWAQRVIAGNVEKAKEYLEQIIKA